MSNKGPKDHELGTDVVINAIVPEDDSKKGNCGSDQGQINQEIGAQNHDMQSEEEAKEPLDCAMNPENHKLKTKQDVIAEAQSLLKQARDARGKSNKQNKTKSTKKKKVPSLGGGFFGVPDIQINITEDDTVDDTKEKAATLQEESKLLQDKHDHLVIFLHGYNNTEEAANKRVVAIDKKLGTSKVITIAFNWKSCCSVLEYTGDQEVVKECAEFFKVFLQTLRDGKVFNQIDIIAHSMGNYLLTRTILFECDEEKRKELFTGCNFICFAADSPRDEYNDAIDKLHGIISNWIHYWCSVDGALLGSTVWNVKRRAGSRACVKYKNVTSKQWKETKILGMNHSYIDDVFGDDDKLCEDVTKRLKLDENA